MKIEYSQKYFNAVSDNNPWKHRFLTFVAWVRENHRYPTKNKAHPLIYHWYMNQKVNLKNNWLSDDQQRLLREVGIKPPDPFAVIQKNNKIWYGMFFEYRKEEKKNPGFHLYDLPKDKRKLYHWIRNTNRFYKANRQLTPFKRQLLERVKWIGSKEIPGFPEMFRQLLSYHKKFGTSHVQQIRGGKYYILSRWVNTLRVTRNRGTLEQWKIDILNTIDFIWDMEVYKYKQQVEQLKNYHEENGHFDVSVNEDLKLAHWVASVRCRPPIEKKRRVLLEEINFEWRGQRQRIKEFEI